MEIKAKFAREVKQAREREGYTQQELAEIVDVTPRSIQNIEYGKHLPRPERMLKIMALLGIGVDIFREEVLESVPVYVIRKRAERSR